MKIIEVDEELYQYIASQTQSIGESASEILRRLLHFQTSKTITNNELTLIRTENSVVAENIPNQQRGIKLEQERIKTPTRKQSNLNIQQIVNKVRSLLASESFQQETKAVVRFLAILRVLYRTDPESFALATESLQGRTRVYFARDEGTLLIAGNHTKPKQIPDTPYWVITNTNSARKMLMLEGAMESMHLPQSLIDEVRVYFIAN